MRCREIEWGAKPSLDNLSIGSEQQRCHFSTVLAHQILVINEGEGFNQTALGKVIAILSMLTQQPQEVSQPLFAVARDDVVHTE